MVFRRVAARAAWGYLALVLLLAPLLGLMHGLVHGAGSDRPVGQIHWAESEAGAEADGAAHKHGHDHHGLNDLFSAHGQAADCRVFDQLSHSGVPSVLPQMALPMALSTFAFLFLEGEVHARWAALFEARGPPLTR